MMGATDEEFAELAFLASFTSRWSAMIHAQNYDINKFVEELQQIGQHLQKMMEK
jgi:alkylhydroperoxidase/carboxymuconolactone decarboxylase family protein YurZ